MEWHAKRSSHFTRNGLREQAELGRKMKQEEKMKKKKEEKKKARTLQKSPVRGYAHEKMKVMRNDFSK